MFSHHVLSTPLLRSAGAQKTCFWSREGRNLRDVEGGRDTCRHFVLCTHFRPFSTISRGVSRYLYSERMILQHPYPAQRCYRQPSLNIPAPRKNKLGCEVEGRSRSSREDGGKERRKKRIGTEGGCKDKRSRGEVGRTQGDYLFDHCPNSRKRRYSTLNVKRIADRPALGTSISTVKINNERQLTEPRTRNSSMG